MRDGHDAPKLRSCNYYYESGFFWHKQKLYECEMGMSVIV